MNLVISKRRSEKVRRAVSLEGEASAARRSGVSGGEDQMSRLRERIASTERGPGERTELAERLVVIGRALNEIDAEDRAILVMRDIDGMDYAEMAEVLEIPLGTLKSRLFRARLALRKRAEELGA
jgi:RNA polymerase sigma-70 factor (ECF subfamily)